MPNDDRTRPGPTRKLTSVPNIDIAPQRNLDRHMRGCHSAWLLPMLLWAHCLMVECADPLGPGQGAWALEDPRQHGLSPKMLDDAREAVFKISGRNCFVVIKNGALVFESYSGIFDNTNTSHKAYSMTKTLGALILGSAVQAGKLDIDTDITKGYGIRSPRPYPVTARQIMSQAIAGSSGPGEAWKYDAAGLEWVNLLTKVVAKAAEKPSIIWQREFHEKLGLAKSFSFDFPGIDEVFAFSSKGTCRDFARIGQLILNKGRWAGINSTIVSSQYVEEMTTPQTKYQPYHNYSNPMYGLLTWLNPHLNQTRLYPGISKLPASVPIAPDQDFPAGFPLDMSFLGGAFGQNVMIVPSDDLVAVSMGTSESDLAGARIAQALTHALCPMLKSCNSHHFKKLK